MYYDLTKILSYNAFLNFVIGARGCGKTYTTTKFVINKFIKNKEEFTYVRRYKSDLKKSVPQFFSAINKNEEFPKHDLTVKGDLFYCDDKVCGYALPLSTAQNLKSSNFSNVKYIIFDEFIPEGNTKYLKNEVEVFLGIIETISRTRNVVVICLANAITMINDYFIYFNINSLPYNNSVKTYKDGLIAIEYVDSKQYTDFKKETSFGKLINNTPFGNYAMDNEFRLDSESFIRKKKGTSKYFFGIQYKGFKYGVWIDNKNSEIVLSNDYLENAPSFACSLEDGSDNTMFLSYARNFTFWKKFIENYRLGNVFFESIKIKNNVTPLFASLIRF